MASSRHFHLYHYQSYKPTIKNIDCPPPPPSPPSYFHTLFVQNPSNSISWGATLASRLLNICQTAFFLLSTSLARIFEWSWLACFDLIPLCHPPPTAMLRHLQGAPPARQRRHLATKSREQGKPRWKRKLDLARTSWRSIHLPIARDGCPNRWALLSIWRADWHSQCVSKASV